MFFFAASLFVLFFLHRKAYRNTQKVAVNVIDLSRAGPAGGRQALHILHLSDLHMEKISVSPRQLYEHIKGKPLDFIMITGDFLDRRKNIPRLIPYLQILQQCQPKYGIYAVFGNHDYLLRRHIQELRQVLQRHGCRILQNENEQIRVGEKVVNVIGIDDFSTKRSDLNASYKGTVPEGYHLVLTHDPNIILEMKGFAVDLMLSGHFHGGQIHWPKPYHSRKMGKLAKLNMLKGLHMVDGKLLYINEGLGQTLFNARLGSRPEITFYKFPLS
jgi:hypothetical protein